jgi:hypothetical protein
VAQSVQVGDVAGSLNRQGYIRIAIDYKYYLAHRLAWLYVYGEWPSGRLDHRDLDRANNRIANLRPATDMQNCANAKRRVDNSTGFKGVSTRQGRYIAQINRDGRRICLGRFDTPEAAHEAYKAAALKHFGEFARWE